VTDFHQRNEKEEEKKSVFPNKKLGTTNK